MNEDYIIMGTAGHIDHGKTALVRALTGSDTDRLQEEKERGISIDIGFAPFLLPGGQKVGIVDVPGHERFIKNMLAGAGGIDLIMLVIDAREGVMPQTREHLAILDLLAISSGVIVVTKVDLVDDEWLAMVHEEIRHDLRGSFLVDAPMLDVSSVTGYGLDTLKQTLQDLLPTVRKKSLQGSFRMPIDRVFTVSGFGTVVTGTVWRGSVQVGQTLTLLPVDESVRVRSLQVHGQATQQVVAGQRAAIAITGVRQVAKRGMTLYAQGTREKTRLVDVRIRVLDHAEVALTHRMRVRLYAGTDEVFGRVLLLGEQEELAAGEQGLAQIELEADLVIEPKDRFVLRTYSPMYTIGGGLVIDAHPSRLHRRHSVTVQKMLLIKEKGSIKDRLVAHLAQQPVYDVTALAREWDETGDALDQALQDLLLEGSVIYIVTVQAYLTASLWATFTTQTVQSMEEFYRKNRLERFMPKPTLLASLKPFLIDARLGEAIVLRLQETGILEVAGEKVRLQTHQIELTSVEQAIYDRVVSEMRSRLYDPPTIQEMESYFPGKDRIVKTILHLLEQDGEVVLIAPELYVSQAMVQEGKKGIAALSSEYDGFSVAQFRDALSTSRKFAVALLEYFDRQKLTKRVGDVRHYLGGETA